MIFASLRLQRGAADRKDAKRYALEAERAVVLEAAARAWKNGVPWANAISIAEGAVAKASASPKPLPKKKAKAKPKASAR